MLLVVLVTSFADTAAAFNTGNMLGNSSMGGTVLSNVIRDTYSREVLFQATPRTKFLQFAKVKTDLTAVKGKSVNFVKYGSLTGGGTVLETAAVNTDTLTNSLVTITVAEQGNSVAVMEVLLRTSLLDVMGDTSKQLAMNLAQVIDLQFRQAVIRGASSTVFGNNVATAASLVAGNGLTASTVKSAVEKLATANAPKFEGEYYVCIAHPHQLRQLRDDAAWINANTYMGRRQLYLGEVGMYEGVIFIETTNAPAFTATAASTDIATPTTLDSMGAAGSGLGIAGITVANTWCGVIFGENAYGWAIALPVELREDPVADLGRRRRIGWYGIWGMGVIEGNNICKMYTA